MKLKRSDLAFGMAGACIGAGLGFIQIGVRSVVGEQADEAWEKVSEPVDAKTAKE
jgi:hypothetical protein